MLAKLMKYELIRRKNTLAIFFSTLLVLELLSLFSIFKGDNWIVLYVVVSIFMVIGASLFVLYDNIKLLSDDLNHTSGYMLFLTPNHGYNMTAAKMMIGFIEVVVTFLFVSLLMYLNVLYVNSIYHIFSDQGVQLIFGGVFEALKVAKVNGFHMVYLVLTYVLEWFGFIVCVYLAIILRKTLFSNSRLNGLYSFLIFVALSVVVNMATQAVALGFITLTKYRGYINTTLTPETDPIMFKNFLLSMLHIGNGLNLIVIVLFFWACGYLLTRRIDL